MKSRFFRNLAKGLVVVSAALAVVNCDESTVAAAQQQYDPNDPLAALSSSGMADPAQVGDVDPTLASSSSTGMVGGGEVVEPGVDVNPASSANVFNPASSADVNPVSSANVNPASSETVAPASSETVVASSSSEAKVESSSSEEVKPAGIFLAEGKEEEKDQMQIVYTENIEPCMFKDGKNLCKILAYPKQLSETQKHAVVVWGPGGGSDPKDYRAIISRLASHGFVVVALRESPGNANEGIEALNWLDKKNKDPNDPLYNKLDMNTVGASGHSMGGLESEQMVIKDKRVLTAFLNNSGDWNGAGANKVATDRSIAILFGEVGMEKDNAKNDYNNAGVKAPACLIEMTGGPRNSEGGYGHGSGSWDGMAATVAWMRWHLGGETERKADFVGSTGKYIDGSIIGKQGHWKTQCKNF
jgi:hypothetical protein